MPARRKKKLTKTEETKISRTLAKGVKALAGRNATKKERAEMLAVAEAMKSRPNGNFSAESVTLWEAKVKFAIAKNDRPSLKQLLQRPQTSAGMLRLQETAFWDSNGGCSCGSGGGSGTANW